MQIRSAATEESLGKRYEGTRCYGKVSVTVDGRHLDPRLELKSLCSDGFEWGYGGSGPAQLALALLVDHLKDSRKALALYQPFKWRVIASLPHNGWVLTEEQIRRALRSL